MRYIYIICIATIILNNPNYAGNDSLSHYSIHELIFHSSLEKDAFNCLNEEKSCNFMKIALATDPSVSYKEYEQYKTHFYDFLDQVKEHRRFQMRPQRQIRYIFNAVHDEYFRLYRENPLFSDIFTSGIFNCATASVLFALAFEYYSIPYNIIVVRNHVYLLAYPEHQSIAVETTNPLRGALLVFDQRGKTQAVQTLLEMKLVTQEEVARKGIDRVFSEVYLAEDIINLSELIGILYSNKAAAQFDFTMNKDTYELLKKSSFFYPGRLTTLKLFLNLAFLIDRADYQDIDTYRFLADLEKFTSFGISDNDISLYGLSFLSRAFSDGNEAIMDSIHYWLNKNLTFENVLSELNYTYYFNKSLKSVNEYRFDEAFTSLEEAYKIKPGDFDLNQIFMQITSVKLRSKNSPIEKLDFLISISERMPEVMGNKRFLTLYQATMLDVINYYYIKSDFDLAEYYRSDFELRFTPEDVVAWEILRYLEEVYSRASLFYFRSNRISRARAILLSGLEYAPNSNELKSKLNFLRR